MFGNNSFCNEVTLDRSKWYFLLLAFSNLFSKFDKPFSCFFSWALTAPKKLISVSLDTSLKLLNCLVKNNFCSSKSNFSDANDLALEAIKLFQKNYLIKNG